MKCPRPKPGASVPPFHNRKEQTADLISKNITQPEINANPALHLIRDVIFIAYPLGRILRVAIFHLLLQFGGYIDLHCVFHDKSSIYQFLQTSVAGSFGKFGTPIEQLRVEVPISPANRSPAVC